MGEKIGNKIIGIAFILGAVGYLASELGFFESFSFTAIVFGIAFAGGAIGGLFNRSINQTVYCGGFCYYFIQNTLGLPRLSLWVILVSATLLVIGFSFVYGGKKTSGKKNNSNHYQWGENSFNNHEEVKAIFADTEKFLNSKVLKSVTLKSIFSSIKIYFDEADMKDNQATVQVSVVFGEVMLFVPRYWNVECNPSVVFGDCNIRGKQGNYEKTLIVTGNVVFGDLEIIYI